jgi:N-acetyltransferase 10
VSLTAARGRGKSAALGLAMAGAVAFGYSNIFVTSPSPENLTTLFEFIFKGKSNRFTNKLNFSCSIKL